MARSPTSTRRSGSIRRCPAGLIDRAVIWRAKGDLDRAIADGTEAIRLAKAKAPVNIMTPPGSVLISAYTQRALAYEAKGDFDNAKKDYAAALEGRASDAGSKANQATAKVRLSLLSEAPAAPPPRNAAQVPRRSARHRNGRSLRRPCRAWRQAGAWRW